MDICPYIKTTEMKKEEINIRIESHLKEDFKTMCKLKGLTMSQKLVGLIECEVYRVTSFKLSLIKQILEEISDNIIFTSSEQIKNTITDSLKKYLSFDFTLWDINMTNNICSGLVCIDDNGANKCLNFTLINHGK